MRHQLLNATRAWVFATIVTTILAVTISAQRVMGSLADLGAQISLSDRLTTTLYDLTHFATLYGVFVLVALLIAFLAGTYVYKKAGFGRWIVYSVAGGMAMLVMLMLMQQAFFGVPIVAGARDWFGLVLQMVAGAIGGLIFHLASKRSTKL